VGDGDVRRASPWRAHGADVGGCRSVGGVDPRAPVLGPEGRARRAEVTRGTPHSPTRERSAHPPRRPPAGHAVGLGPRVRPLGREAVSRQDSVRSRSTDMASRRTQAHWIPRVPPHLRLVHDRRWRKREGVERPHGPLERDDHVRPLRPPHARCRAPGSDRTLD
jgi:hypothetical protein